MLDLIRDIFSFADPEVLGQFVRAHGPLVYLALFGIVFAETGLVVTPFLPGDSLLFAAGAVAALGDLGFLPMAGTLIAAAVLGDAVNYAVGRRLGPRIFRGETRDGLFARLVNRGHLESARRFFEKHGGKAVVLARFVPIVRTFVPFVAGAGTMNYRRFALYNVVGAVAWVLLCCGAGYLFGNLEPVRRNFELVLVGIIVVSVLPIVIQWLRSRRAGHAPVPAV